MSVLGAYLSRTFSTPPRATPRIDDKLPLGIKIGSLVNIDPAPFVLAKQAGLLVDQPDRQQVAAIGKIRYQGNTIYRFYFEDGKHMLQVALDGAGVMADDPFIYKLMPEIRPRSEEEWANWLADPDKKGDTGYIGFKTFDLWDLAATPPAQLASYARAWKEQLGDQAPVEEFNETLYREPYEGRAVKVRHSDMMYSRVPPNPGAFPAGVDVPDEWALVSASEYPGDSVVQMYVGMPIAKETISVVMS